MRITVLFDRPIDSKRLYDSFDQGIYKRFGTENLYIKVDVVDLTHRTYLIAEGGCSELIAICLHCWSFAPFEMSVEVPEEDEI